MPKHELVGCRPEPLGSYLKALGVLRLVATQADPTARASWAPQGFVLHTELDDDALVRFFLDDYRPTPIVSPWNNSSGFGGEGAGELHVIEASDDDRLGPYRLAIAAARRLLAEREAHGWSKEEMLAACRSRLPDDCVDWLDAAAILVDGRAVYPPLLGTGGNDGRLEFSRNFHQRVLDVVGLSRDGAKARSGWLERSLFDTGGSPGLRNRSPGQFDAGAAGGANSAAVGAADSVLNPWDWVLLLEGALVVASGSARRLASDTDGRAASPFTVDATAAGYPTSVGGENGRGEFWAPLWQRPAGLPEVRRLFAEARADWRGGHVRSGLDLAKAAGGLGVDRGIDAFARHAFVERFGLSTVAVAAGRLPVRPRAAVPPLAQLDAWLAGVRGLGGAPAAVRAALRSVERLSFDVARGADLVLDLLVAVAELERAVARAGRFRSDSGARPVTGLDATDWLALLPLDASPELRVAAALSSARDGGAVSGLRLLLDPVEVSETGRVRWATRPPLVAGLGQRSLPGVLADALVRRAVDVVAAARTSAAGEDERGVDVHFRRGLSAPLPDTVRFAGSELDDDAVARALGAFLVLDWRSPVALTPAERRPGAAPPSLAMLAPFTSPPAIGVAGPARSWCDRLRAVRLRPDPHWFAQLRAGQVGRVVADARLHLRLAGLEPVPAADAPPAIDVPGGLRLCAALLCRLSPSDRALLLEYTCPPDPDAEATASPPPLAPETPHA